MPDNLKLLKNIFAEMEKPLFLGDGLTSGEFHSLMQPGQFISTNLKEADNSDDMAIQSALTDDLIDTQFVYTPLTGSISEQYRFIMEAAALPLQPLSQADKAEIEKHNKWIADNGPTYTVYSKYYYDALDAYSQEANSAHPAPGKLQHLYQKMTTALSNWNTVGKKKEYETRQARVIYLLSGDPSTLWNDYRTLLAFNDRVAPTRGPYLQNFLIPSVSQWNSPGTSWALFDKTINESSSYNYSHTTSWGAGGSAGWGMFSFGGGGGGSTTYTHSESDVAAVNINFEYLRVRIDRRWLKSDIFGYRWWWWKKQFGYRQLSDGGNLHVNPPVRPRGLFPFLPQHLVVARNLRITANFSHNDQTIITSNISGSAGFGWGPFSLSGSYSEATSEQTTHASFNGTTISIDQPQIIAFTGPLMPISPNPDRTLPWQGDQAPFDPPEDFTKSRDRVCRYESDVGVEDVLFSSAQTEAFEKLTRQWDEQRRAMHKNRAPLKV